MIKEVCS